MTRTDRRPAEDVPGEEGGPAATDAQAASDERAAAEEQTAAGADPAAQERAALGAPAPPGGKETPEGPRRPWVRRLRRGALALVLLLLVPLLAAEAALWVNHTGDFADGTRTRDRDALWL